ncbi:MAG: DUF86 domain-containing protein [Desulfobacterales bacterium]|nr:MAG: DUF86 domain-containing protein [Desulfobacterales bacterium]
MVDEALILRKLSQLDEYHKQLKEYDNISTAAYAADWKVQRIVERTLQMIIETCVDITGHIIADKGYRTPTSYADTFKVLYEESILDGTLFSVLEKMAKFRNIVVHSYDRIDAEIVVSILRNDLQDFTAFKDSVINFLKSEKAPTQDQK